MCLGSENTLSQVWWPPCALRDIRGHWFNVSSGHNLAAGTLKPLSLQEVSLFGNGWMCEGHAKIIHFVGVTGRSDGKGLEFKCKSISAENAENVEFPVQKPRAVWMPASSVWTLHALTRRCRNTSGMQKGRSDVLHLQVKPRGSHLEK